MYNLYLRLSLSGHEIEAHNNPADFFLDVINGDSTALDADKKEEMASNGKMRWLPPRQISKCVVTCRHEFMNSYAV